MTAGIWTRLCALINKEFKQLLRDRSSMLIGVALPIMLIFIIGYGLSLDVKKVPTAVVLQDTSPVAQDMLSFMTGSDYFEPHYVTSMPEAVELMDKRQVDAIVVVPPRFTQQLYQQRGQVQLILYGVEAATATMIKSYVESGLAQWQQSQLSLAGAGQLGTITVAGRLWFNEANTSTWYFIPGIIVLIMSIVGIFLTSLVMAREWERGTLEAIFVTPVHAAELVLAKIAPYFCVAMLGFALCLASAYYIFGVPVRGSLGVIIFSSMLYLLVALGIGLTISALTKNQFLACQVSLLVSIMPVMMLTGFLFDLRSVPAWISAIGYVLPPTYYMQLLKTLLLAGNNWGLIVKNNFILLGYAILFMALALKVTRKRLD